MFSAKECLVISWDRQGEVRGITLQHSKAGYRILSSSHIISGSGKSLSSAINEANDCLECSSDAVIALTGHIPHGVYLELSVPHLAGAELQSLLEYELMHQVPYASDELVWCYEIVDGQTDDQRRVVRIYAVPEDDWGSVVSELQLSGICADLFIPVFMSETNSEVCYLPGMNQEFAFSSQTRDGLHSFVVSSDYSCEPSRVVDSIDYAGEIEPRDISYTPLLLCATHLLSKHAKLYDQMMHLPAEMKPQRLRAVRSLFLLVASLFVVVSISFAVRMYRGNSMRMKYIQAEQAMVEAQLSEMGGVKTYEQGIIRKVDQVANESYGEEAVLDHLIVLTKQIPHQMRLSRFMLRDNHIDLTIVSGNYSDSALMQLQKNPRYKVVSVRKQTFRGTTTVDVKLDIRRAQL